LPYATDQPKNIFFVLLSMCYDVLQKKPGSVAHRNAPALTVGVDNAGVQNSYGPLPLLPAVMDPRPWIG
jgi:hypothetical protein